MVSWAILKNLTDFRKTLETGMDPRLRAGHRANRSAVTTILPAWFDHVETSFSYKKVLFKSFARPWKPVVPAGKHAILI